MIRWTLAVLAAIALTGAARTARAQPEDPITVLVHVTNQAEVPPGVLTHAFAEATRAYSEIGVTLMWTESAAAENALRVRVISKALGGIFDHRLGVAPGTQEGRRFAYVYYGPIERVAQSSGTDVAILLGHVIAHELGHLLLPHGSHTLNGVMTGRWDMLQLELARTGELTFTRDQGKVIRQRLDHAR